MITEVYLKNGFNSRQDIFVENDLASHLNDKARGLCTNSSQIIFNELGAPFIQKTYLGLTPANSRVFKKSSMSILKSSFLKFQALRF